MANTRFLASGEAPLAGLHYSDKHRDDISVLLYDQKFLATSGSDWPISYGSHADWLLSMVENEKLRPKAIFYDITFNRKDASLGELKEALCRARHEFNVPIFLAGLASNQDGKLHIRPELEEALHDPRGPCFSLVGVNLTPDPIDHVSWHYPLAEYLTEIGWQPELEHGEHALGSFRSAATVLAQDVGGLELGEELGPLAVQWGARQSKDELASENSYCRVAEWKVDNWRFLPGIFRPVARWFGVFNEEHFNKPLCPYHSSLSMGALQTLPEEQLAPRLHDKYVLIGAQIPGYNDLITSPVNGEIPGVFLHAMALDNLLTDGEHYRRGLEWEKFWAERSLLASALLATLGLFGLNVAWRYGATFLKSKLPKSKLPKWFSHCSLWLTDAWHPPQCMRRLYANSFCTDVFFPLSRRCWHGFFRFLGWSLKLSFQYALVLLFIVELQGWFSIGMLPVAELAAIIVFAEALEIYEKLEKVVLGEKFMESIFEKKESEKWSEK